MDGDRGEIQRRAYEIWEREGRPSGRDFDHWLAAEAELAAERAQAPPAGAPAEAEPARKPRTPRAAKLTTDAPAAKRPASRPRKPKTS